MSNKQKGITLIALVITIIVLLILAGVSISLLVGNNGILSKSKDSKMKTEIAEEKEILNFSIVQAKGEKFNEVLEKSKFESALEQNSREDNKASLIGEDDEKFFVQFAREGRYYEVDKNGNIDYMENITGSTKTLKIQCKNSNGELLAEKEYIILGNRYSKLPPEIEGYEASDEKIEGEITEDKTIIETYYLVLQDDTTLVFTGLNSNGDITTNESDIVSYMVGDGENANSGLTQKGKSMLSVLRVPESYKGKPVIKIGNLAFRLNTTVKKAVISDVLQVIGTSAFHDAYGLNELVLGKSVISIGNNGFTTCSNLKKVTFKCKMQDFGTVFANTNKWTEIEIDTNNDSYKVVDNVLYSKDGERLIIVPKGKGNFKIEEGTKILGQTCFAECYKITSVEIPDSVEKLEKASFFRDSQIKSFIIGSSVKDIDSLAFWWDNSALEDLYINSIEVSKQLTSQTSAGGLIKFGVKNIYFNENINEIGSYVISNYTETTSDKQGYKKYVKNN